MKTTFQLPEFVFDIFSFIRENPESFIAIAISGAITALLAICIHIDIRRKQKLAAECYRKIRAIYEADPAKHAWFGRLVPPKAAEKYLSTYTRKAVDICEVFPRLLGQFEIMLLRDRLLSEAKERLEQLCTTIHLENKELCNFVAQIPDEFRKDGYKFPEHYTRLFNLDSSHPAYPLFNELLAIGEIIKEAGEVAAKRRWIWWPVELGGYGDVIPPSLADDLKHFKVWDEGIVTLIRAVSLHY